MKKLIGFDEAVIGPAVIWYGSSPEQILVYDANIIRQLLVKGGLSWEEAREYIEFNIEGAYVGKDAPIVVWPDDNYWTDCDEGA